MFESKSHSDLKMTEHKIGITKLFASDTTLHGIKYAAGVSESGDGKYRRYVTFCGLNNNIYLVLIFFLCKIGQT